MGAPYEIRYAEAAVEDLRRLRPFDQRAILDAVVQHLSHEPRRVSRSRIKAILQPFWSQYRLRVGDFRVYYDVEDAPARVNVLRVLEKGRMTTAEAAP